MITREDRRRVSAANILLGAANTAVSSEEFEDQKEQLLNEATNLLIPAVSHPDRERLLGVTAQLAGDNRNAVMHFRKALESGDVTALPRLEIALRNGEHIQAADSVRDEFQRLLGEGNPDAIWAAVRESIHIGELLGENEVHSYARSSHEMARVKALMESLTLGEPMALSAARVLATESPIMARSLGKFLRTFNEIALQDDISEAEWISLLKWAHEQGDIEATYLLWLYTGKSNDDSYEDVLDEVYIDESRRNGLEWSVGDLLGNLFRERAEEAIASDDHLVALRIYQAAAQLGFDPAVQALGQMIQNQAENQGSWAVLGSFLSSWPPPLDSNLVGSVNFPLDIRTKPPALRDDHESSIPIESSDFAQRIVQAYEQVGWVLEPLGDHLLVGTWLTDAGPSLVYIEIGHDFDDHYSAYISVPILVGLPDDNWPSWALTANKIAWANNEPEVKRATSERYRTEVNRINAYRLSLNSIQRRFIEALFRIGENESRDFQTQGMGSFGWTLGGILGRTMTFPTCPNRLYPTAWTSTLQSDYLSTSSICSDPEKHKLKHPLEICYIGYTLSSDLSGSHLQGAILGCTNSLTVAQEYLTLLFDSEPGIFEEFFHAVPMLRILDKFDNFNGAITKTQANLLEFGLVRASDHELDPIELNNLAWMALQSGEYQEAMSGFEIAASLGQPNALATLIWHLLLVDQRQRAVDIYLEYFPVVQQFLANYDGDSEIFESMQAQIPNCQSNVALALYSLGDRIQAAKLWKLAGKHGHIEARIYPAIVVAAQGNLSTARWVIGALDAAEISEFVETMESVIREGEGWFEEWAEFAIETIENL